MLLCREKTLIHAMPCFSQRTTEDCRVKSLVLIRYMKIITQPFRWPEKGRDIAEVESANYSLLMESPGHQPGLSSRPRPQKSLGRQVVGQSSFTNSFLSRFPFLHWQILDFLGSSSLDSFKSACPFDDFSRYSA